MCLGTGKKQWKQQKLEAHVISASCMLSHQSMFSASAFSVAGSKLCCAVLCRSVLHRKRLLHGVLCHDRPCRAVPCRAVLCRSVNLYHQQVEETDSGAYMHAQAAGRKPSATLWSAARRENALSRDFTVNGLLFDPFSGMLYDYVGGLADCKQRLLKTIGPPMARFQDDPARILRAVRLASRAGTAPAFKFQTAFYTTLSVRSRLLAALGTRLQFLKTDVITPLARLHCGLVCVITAFCSGLGSPSMPACLDQSVLPPASFQDGTLHMC